MSRSHDDVVVAYLIDLQDNGNNNFTGKIDSKINFDKFMNNIRPIGYSYVTVAAVKKIQVRTEA